MTAGPDEPAERERAGLARHLRAIPCRSPRRAGRSEAGPQAPQSLHGWVCGLLDLQHQRSILFTASPEKATSCWWEATSWWEGVPETLSCPSLCSTNHPLFFIPVPAPAGCPLSISCHIFPVLQTVREKSPAGSFAKPGRETGHFPECFEPRPSQGSAGCQEWFLGGCEGGHLERMLHLHVWLNTFPSHLPFWEKNISDPSSSHPVLKASSKARGTAVPFRGTQALVPVAFPVVKS